MGAIRTAFWSDVLIRLHVLISCVFFFFVFFRKVSFILIVPIHLAGGRGVTYAGEPALALSGLTAHGKSADGLGHHIDLALTDTCQ